MSPAATPDAPSESGDDLAGRGTAAGDTTHELTRQITACLADHLPEYGFSPYEIPDHATMARPANLLGPNLILVQEAGGRAWVVTVDPLHTVQRNT